MKRLNYSVLNSVTRIIFLSFISLNMFWKMNCWSHRELRRWRNGSLECLRELSFLSCSVEKRCLRSICIGCRMKTQICISNLDAWMASFNCLTAIISLAAAAEPPAKTKRGFHQVLFIITTQITSMLLTMWILLGFLNNLSVSCFNFLI